MIVWISALAWHHPWTVISLLTVAVGVVALGGFRGRSQAMPESIPVIGRWHLDDESSACHGGHWILQIEPQGITVTDPHGTARSSPCVIDFHPHGPALVLIAKAVGLGNDTRLLAFIPERDGRVTLVLSRDELDPGCRHLVTRE
jgi:hypothetical protein